MNQRVLNLFDIYRNVTDNPVTHNPVAAALLTVADVRMWPDPIIVEPEDAHVVSA